MRTTLTLLGKELRQIFFSPLAYIVLLLFMIVNGVSFYAAVIVLSRVSSSGSLVTWMFNTPWFYLSYFGVFPLITMRLIAEEKKSGTLETLLTAPVRTSQLVLSKYLASVIFYLILWVPSMVNIVVFQLMTHRSADIPEGQLYGSYAIVMLMGLFHLAAGLFASALSKNQIVAAVITLTIILLHYFLGMTAVNFSSARMLALSDYISTYAAVEHFRQFPSGLIDSRPIVYYVSLSVLFLYLTHQVLEFRRWKT
jgi:ABC-2 type transport system permease protein